MSVANIAGDHQEHFCVEKVVEKKVTGGNPAFIVCCCYSTVLSVVVLTC